MCRWQTYFFTSSHKIILQCIAFTKRSPWRAGPGEPKDDRQPMEQEIASHKRDDAPPPFLLPASESLPNPRPTQPQTVSSTESACYRKYTLHFIALLVIVFLSVVCYSIEFPHAQQNIHVTDQGATPANMRIDSIHTHPTPTMTKSSNPSRESHGLICDSIVSSLTMVGL